jgi:hypothetical protein
MAPNRASDIDQARCLSWVKNGTLTVGWPLPVHLGQRTLSEPVGMSQTCQQETHAPHKMTFLFDHLVGERK